MRTERPSDVPAAIQELTRLNPAAGVSLKAVTAKPGCTGAIAAASRFTSSAEKNVFNGSPIGPPAVHKDPPE